MKLAGFSSDGGNTFFSVFNSPEDSVANTVLYADTEPKTIIALGLFGIYLTASLNVRKGSRE
ncbi:MAG: hypothetical protein F6K25_13160 [Okeania sp. SIO2G4]|nr:hypothetical protein [Okeania sp. SIO4D6]NEP43984.1 hypothetical protein [Okeania sp. SIO2H7]NEP72883.1 hypothetical protein [Okeania sp. SIO2G5]NEP93670.1 hypothetical protein [Okeania sp. SIO2F5]NEQ91598.1 hypothetical protein [Okeania sp. SIO2G4]